jgi:anti-sigma regulatory factor (Ser/Thr protein kinase)
VTDGLDTRSPAGSAAGARVHSLDLRGSDPRALRRVRQWLTVVLADCGDEHIGEVMQIADELVSNAYEHGGGPQVIRLCCGRVPGRTVVEVEDSNMDALTVGRSRFGTAAYRGRGLMLVRALSAAWGVRREPGSGCKTVWAEVVGG